MAYRTSTDVTVLYGFRKTRIPKPHPFIRPGGIFKGLNNAKLKELGREIVFYEGLPTFFDEVRRRVAADATFRQHEVRVEHYIVSTGLRAMIEGSAITPFVEGIWASEFAEGTPGPGYLRDSTLLISNIALVFKVWSSG